MGGRGLRPRRAAPDAGVRHDRSRPRHERLDGGPVPVPRRGPWTAARCSRRRTSTGSAGSRATRTWTATAIGWRTLPGTPHPKAAYFTRGTGHDENANYSENHADVRAEPRARSRRKLDRRARILPAPERARPRRRAGRPRRLRLVRLRGAGGARPAPARGGARDGLPARARVPVLARRPRVRRRARAGLRRRAEPRRPARGAPEARPAARGTCRGSGPSRASTGCPSTRAPSRTPSAQRRAR